MNNNTGLAVKRSLLGTSWLLLILSFFFPYWEALKTSGSLASRVQLTVYATHSSGPLREHLPWAQDLSRLEHSVFEAAALAIALLALAALFAKRAWSWLLCLPAILLPAAICADASTFLAAACASTAGCGAGLAVRAGTGVHLAWGAAAFVCLAWCWDSGEMALRASQPVRDRRKAPALPAIASPEAQLGQGARSTIEGAAQPCIETT